MNQGVRTLRDLSVMAIPGERSICKCCGGLAPLFGRVDFQKNCMEENGFYLPTMGVLVPYFRCDGCGFLFTRFFDHWTSEEFQAHIYNEAYALVDPEYATQRPNNWAATIATQFQEFLPRMSVLDWGGGTGRLAEVLRERGAHTAETWDPFNSAHRAPREESFNLVTCIEVLEHLPDPKGGMRSLVSHLPGVGAVLLSTLIQPADILALGPRWWYIAPRNGHISVHTAKSLEALCAGAGFRCTTILPHVHWAWREMPFYLKQEGAAIPSEPGT